MRISTIVAKSLVVLALAAICIPASVIAKPKKEKITDPRLLRVMSMSKLAKESQFISKSAALATSARAVQGFDVDADEQTIWYAQPGTLGKKSNGQYQQGTQKVHENYIVRRSGSQRDRMTLRYFGRGNNITVEHAADGDYVWLGGNGSKFKGEYSRTKTLCRVPFVKDAEYNDGYAGEVYYFGGEQYVWGAVKPEYDLMGIATTYKGSVKISIYSISEARALEEKNVKISTKWKGENIGEEEVDVKRQVKARNLGNVEPISTFTIPKPEKENANRAKDINSCTFRGFDIDKDYVYFVEGNHNSGKLDEKGSSVAYITVFDHNGNIKLPRRQISVIFDYQMLKNLGITENGYADIAGIKVKEDKIYIAFSAYNPSGNFKGHRATVVKYE